MNDRSLPASLSKAALLVDLTVSTWLPYTSDERADGAVRAQYQNDVDTGNYRKKLLPTGCDEWAAITRAHGALVRTHRFFSQPWSAGVRIMPAAVYNEYSLEMKPLRVRFEEAADAFCDRPTYNRIVTDALKKLGGLARREDYPDPSDIRARFAVDIAFMPLPERGDFRVDVERKAREAIMESYDRMLAQAMDTATADLWKRLHESVDKLRGSVAKYHAKAGGDQRTALKSSTFDNMRRLLEILPRLNVTADHDLASVAASIEDAFAGIDADALKEDAATRSEVVKRADAIMDQMAAFMGGAR